MGEPGLARARLAANSRWVRSSSSDVSLLTSGGRAAGLAGAGASVLLGGDCGELALDISADRGISPQGLQAPRELVAVQVQLAGWELTNLAAVLVGRGHYVRVPSAP
jgi:hypothetical protein